jgi:hypothetical protein
MKKVQIIICTHYLSYILDDAYLDFLRHYEIRYEDMPISRTEWIKIAMPEIKRNLELSLDARGDQILYTELWTGVDYLIIPASQMDMDFDSDEWRMFEKKHEKYSRIINDIDNDWETYKIYLNDIVKNLELAG